MNNTNANKEVNNNNTKGETMMNNTTTTTNTNENMKGGVTMTNTNGATNNNNTNVKGGVNMNNVTMNNGVNNNMEGGVNMNKGLAGKGTQSMVTEAVISNKTQLDNWRSKLIVSGYCSIYTVEIGAENISIYGTAMPMSRTYRDAIIEPEMQVVTLSGNVVRKTKDSFAPFTYEEITVKFKDATKAKEILDYGIAIKHNGLDTCAFTRIIVGKDKVTKKYIKMWLNSKTGEMTETLPEGAKLYKVLNFSASNLRTIQLVFADVTDGDNRANKLNSTSKMAFKLAGGKRLTLLDLIKLSSRFGQANAGSVNWGSMPGFYKMNGKIKNMEAGENFMDESHDGGAYVSAEWLAEVLTEILGVKVMPAAVMGMHIQCRPGTMKTAAVAVPEKFLGYIYKKQMANIAARGSNETITMVGDRQVMFADANAIKAEFDLNLPLEFEVLNYAKNNGIRTSKQMMIKFFMENPEATDAFLDELFEESIMTKFKTTIFERKTKIMTPEDIDKVINGNGYTTDIITSYAPELITKNKSIFKSVMNNLTQNIVNSVNKMGFDIDGAYTSLIADIVSLVSDNRLLQYGEIYARAAERYMQEKGLETMKIAGFKYPTIGMKEYYLATVVTLKEAKKRIKDMDMDKELKDLLTTILASMSDGAAMLPAIKLIKKQCAGLDYDFDAMALVFDQRAVAILEPAKPEIVDVDDEDYEASKKEAEAIKKANTTKSKLAQKFGQTFKTAEVDMYDLSVDSLGVAFRTQAIENKNEGIGVMTNRALSQDLTMFNPAVAKAAIMRNIDGAGYGKEKYVPLTVLEKNIDGKKVDYVNAALRLQHDMMDNIVAADLDDVENIVNIIRDLNRIYRNQEKIIDAAKKATQVVLEIGFFDLRAECLNGIVYNLDYETAQFTYERTQLPPTSKKVVFRDVMAMAQDRMMAAFAEVMNDEVLTMKVEYDDKFISMLSGKIAMVQKYPMISDLTKEIKTAYKHCARAYAMSMNEMFNEDGEEKTNEEQQVDALKRAELREQFVDNCAVLSSMVRQLFAGSDLSLADQGLILQAAVMMKGSGTNRAVDKTCTNQMALNLCPEMFLSSMFEYDAKNSVCGYKIINKPALEEGQMLDFVSGTAGKVLIASDFTGTLEARCIDERWYAVRPIVINPVETNPEKVAFIVREAIDIRTGEHGVSYDGMIKALTDEKSQQVVTLNHGARHTNGEVVSDAVKIHYTSTKGVDSVGIIGRYCAESKVMSSMLAGVTGKVSKTILPKDENGKVVSVIVELDVMDRVEEDVTVNVRKAMKSAANKPVVEDSDEV